MVRMLVSRMEHGDDPVSMRRMRKFHPMMIEELMHMSLAKGNELVGAQMALGLIRSQMPWVYDAGIEAISIIRSRRRIEEKQEALHQFGRVLEFSFEHPMMRDLAGGSKEMHFIYRRMPSVLMDVLGRNVQG